MQTIVFEMWVIIITDSKEGGMLTTGTHMADTGVSQERKREWGEDPLTCLCRDRC